MKITRRRNEGWREREMDAIGKGGKKEKINVQDQMHVTEKILEEIRKPGYFHNSLGDTNIARVGKPTIER